MRDFTFKAYIPQLVIAAFTVFILFSSTASPFTFVYPEFDSAVYLYVSKMWARGYIPYADVWDNKGPVLYFINTLGYVLLGGFGPWLVQLACCYLTALFAYKVSLNLGCGKAAGVAAGFYMAAVTYTLHWGGVISEEYGLPAMMATLYITSCVHTQKRFFKWRETLVIGVLCGYTLLIRVNLVALWAALVLFVFGYLVYKKSFVTLIRHALLFLAGVAGVALPFAVYFLYHGALDDLVFAVFTSSMGLLYNSLLGNLYSGVNTFFRLTCGAYAVIIIYFSVALLRAVYAEKGKKEPIEPLFLLCWLGISTVANSVSGYDYPHYAILYVPIICIPICRLLRVACSVFKDEGFKSKLKQAGGAAFIVMLLLFQQPDLFYAWSTYNGKSLLTGRLERDSVADYILENTAETDMVATVGWLPHINYLTMRPLASPHFYILTEASLSPAVLNQINSRAFDDICDKKPAVIVETVVLRENFLDSGDFWRDYEWVVRYNKLLETDYALAATDGEALVYRRNATDDYR
jgi:hypothetical protein